MKLRNTAVLLSVWAALAGCGAAKTTKQPELKAAAAGFCGSSTRGACSSDADCVTGGCSGQVCQSKSEPGEISTCEYRDCYDAAKYSLKCGCAAGACQWE